MLTFRKTKRFDFVYLIGLYITERKLEAVINDKVGADDRIKARIGIDL